MLYPKQTNCPENGDINFLIFSIDCRLSKLANTMYNNTVFMLNKTISSTAIFDLIQYKRILFYKQINPDYVACYSVNQIASQVKKLTAGFAGSSSSSSFDPPATRTTTTTTSISTTTTTSSTTTTTTTIKVLGCNVSSEFSGGDFYPTTESVILGSVIGTVVLNYNTENIPDRFIVQWNGNDVIDTGYRGPDSYDFGGAVRGFFNSTLEGKVDPITFVTYPNFTNYPDDGYPRVSAPGIGTASFYKNSTTSASATVKIYSPTDSEVYDPGDRVWLYTLTCPVPTTTTTTSSTTTTTTTLPPELFRIQASNITAFDAPDANPGMIITSLIAFSIDWGDGSVEPFIPGTYSISHFYTGTYSGPITILSTNLTQITELEILSQPHNAPQSLSVTTEELGNLDGLLNFKAESTQGVVVNGDVNDLPKTLTSLIIARSNLIGDTNNLPKPSLTICRIRGGNTIFGTTSNLPRNLTILEIEGGNIIDGTTAGLPRTSLICTIGGQNTITGNTLDLPDPTQTLSIAGQNTISGNIADLSRAVTVSILGRNTISGNLSGFGVGNTTTTLLRLGGFPTPTYGNTVTGNISDFPTNLTILEIGGKSAISGSLSDLPTGLTTLIINTAGICTFSGSISNLPSTLDFVQLSSDGTFTGNLFYLPLGIRQFNVGMTMNNITYVPVLPDPPSTTRTWANNFFAISTSARVGSTWTGFTTAETDALLVQIAPKYVSLSDQADRFTLLCSGTPKRSNTTEVNDAFNTINDAMAPANAIILN
jgi:hypothetical protein